MDQEGDNEAKLDTAVQVEAGTSSVSADDKKRSRKGRYRNELFKKRKENGIWLLSKKDEDKIYRIKKGMRKKGMSTEDIREETRKVRRTLELNFKKCDKKCFKCRRLGHTVANCPDADKAFNDEDGDLISDRNAANICYKCGSTEHKLFQCNVKGADLPFASCYICNGQGHISRDCPKNSNGIYPKGGCCKECGSVNHLVKDCPDNKDHRAEGMLPCHFHCLYR